MNNPQHKGISKIQQGLRWFACMIVPIWLLLVAIIILLWQFTEITSRQEVLSLTSFLVILTLSALSFNWSRATHTFATEATRETIYRAGIDLFLASLLALIASCFAWLQSNRPPASFYAIPLVGDLINGHDRLILSVLFWTHWTFLCLALLMTIGAISSIVLTIPRSGDRT